MVAAMTDRDLTVTLELHVRGDCLSGRITGESGPAIEFSGRIGMLRAIETVVADDFTALPRADVSAGET